MLGQGEAIRLQHRLGLLVPVTTPGGGVAVLVVKTPCSRKPQSAAYGFCNANFTQFAYILHAVYTSRNSLTDNPSVCAKMENRSRHRQTKHSLQQREAYFAAQLFRRNDGSCNKVEVAKEQYSFIFLQHKSAHVLALVLLLAKIMQKKQ
eukprot:3673985-Pleurochrysis_carterae.AAC.6